MWRVTVSRKTTGRVQRRKFDSLDKARKFANRQEDRACRHKSGLKTVRIELGLAS